MPRMPNLYNCVVCGLEVRPSDAATERKAIVWLKSTGKTISEVAEELYEYKHKFCTAKNSANDIPLF